MSRAVQAILFATACLLPAVLIVVAAFVGGVWVWLALASITVLVVCMDRFGPQFATDGAFGIALPVVVGSAHFVVLAATLWAVGQNDDLGLGAKILLVAVTGLFAGQVSNACAHELIHRRDAFGRRLGTAVYCSMLNGHHVSAHLLVHHVHACTDKDPNSAPLGQGFYRYLVKTSVAEFRAGLAAETARYGKSTSSGHPYLVYALGAGVSLLAAWFLGGVWAVVALLAISLHAQSQLLLSDYVQHYGLRRETDAMGKPEPMGPQHSWNAPQSYSSALMMNAPRHSDHHMNPARDFTQLRLDDRMPVLPRSFPVMGAVALIPPLWRRMMDRRVAKWGQGKIKREQRAKASGTSQFIGYAVEE